MEGNFTEYRRLTEDWRQETGDRRLETGEVDRIQETGDWRQDTENTYILFRL